MLSRKLVTLTATSIKSKGVSRCLFHHVTRLMAPVKIGDSLPSVDLYEKSPMDTVNVAKLCENKKVIIFGVPGAFTPGCSQTHLPGYIKRSDELRQKGTDEVVCVAVNDPFVMAAWGKAQDADGKVRMLADTKAEFTTALGLTLDLKDVLGSIRSKRYSMVVQDGKVTSLQVEPDGTGLTCSLAENLSMS